MRDGLAKSRLPKTISTWRDFQRGANALLPAGFVLRPRAFPSSPQRNVSEVKLVPPQIQHLLIETQNTVARDSRRRRNERCQAVVNGTALRFANASEKMPDGERVALPRLREDFAEFGAPLLRRVRRKVKLGQGFAKRFGSVIKIRSAGPHFGPCCANRARGDEGFMSVQLETNPSEFCSENPRAGIVHLQRIGTAQVYCDG